MAAQNLRTGWYSRGPDEHLFVWGSARDVTDDKHRVIFVLTSGDDACQILSLELGTFLEYLVRYRFRHTTESPHRLPPDFPTNLFVNKLA